jgi:hypothetical protein
MEKSESFWSTFTVEADDEQRVMIAKQWLWLTGEPLVPVLITAMGDYFAEGEGDDVYFVDTNWGRYEKVAPSYDALLAEIRSGSVTDWFYFELVRSIIASGRKRGERQCFSFMHPPMLGGQIAVANVEPIDLVTHTGIHAQIARQIRDLPPGTKIRRVVLLDNGGVALETDIQTN